MPTQDDSAVPPPIVAVLLRRQASALNQQLATTLVARVANIAIALYAVSLGAITYPQLAEVALTAAVLSFVWWIERRYSDKIIYQVEESLIRASLETAMLREAKWEDAYIRAVKPLALFRRDSLALRSLEPAAWMYLTCTILTISYLVPHAPVS